MQTQGTIIGRWTAGARARRGLATVTNPVPADGWPIVTVTNPFPARRMAIVTITKPVSAGRMAFAAITKPFPADGMPFATITRPVPAGRTPFVAVTIAPGPELGNRVSDQIKSILNSDPITITTSVTKVTIKRGSSGSGYGAIGKGRNSGSAIQNLGTVTVGGKVYWDGTNFLNNGANYLKQTTITYQPSN